MTSSLVNKLFDNKSCVRSRAPLRLGLAGGGTDLSPYCDDFGGAVLNATIGYYAVSTLQVLGDSSVSFVAHDLGRSELLSCSDYPFDISDGLQLHKAVYNRLIAEFNDGQPISLNLTTSVDCPMGSGLGASSSLVVSMIGAFKELLNLPLSDYDIAHLAYSIERSDLGMSGGRQDQYTATFGGINFMEFAANDRVLVNPLHLPSQVINELESSLLICFTGGSRVSSKIIDKQVKAMTANKEKSIQAMHQLKKDALEMKAAFIKNELSMVSDILNRSWEAKKATAKEISNTSIDDVYQKSIDAGAMAGKISGAGGGGFMMLLVDPTFRKGVVDSLSEQGFTSQGCNFTVNGLQSWVYR